MGGPQEKAKSLTFSSSLRRCEILLTASGQKPAAEQLEMIRSSAMSFANLKERKQYYLSLNEEMIDILQAVPPQKLAELQSEKFEVHFQRLLEISLISSQILHDEPKRANLEHQVFFTAFFSRLSEMGQSKRAIQIANTFQKGSWKQRAVAPLIERIGRLQEKPKILSFSSSLQKCIERLDASGHKSAVEQLEMIRFKALSIDNEEELRQYYLPLKEKMIDILQSIPPQTLSELRSENLDVNFKYLLDISLISSRILHDEPERVYPEHKIFFAALFWQLSKMKQIKRAIEFENTFQENSWKQRAAVDGIVAALPPEDLEKLD